MTAILLGRGRREAEDGRASRLARLRMPAGQWAWKLALMALAYLAIYFAFGLLVAWRNPELRAMYGNGTNEQVFNQWLLPFQAMRALLWVCFVLPVIRMARGRTWQVALVVALLFSLAPAIGLVTPNPYMPVCQRAMVALLGAAVVQFPLWLAGDGGDAVATAASSGSIRLSRRFAGRRALTISKTRKPGFRRPQVAQKPGFSALSTAAGPYARLCDRSQSYRSCPP